ncbi:TPA: hypothetical protein NJ597_003262 [Vibrio parahaemolyticus]|nr:hypothetical protein [Vibrio parahaemolyticus]HCG6405394.1 hypothetical protein [Vibrio parahaemolyticus]HCG8180616.1 hypothetical protein [Vibrio parahaemolyticus]HCG9161491.1 hypothetical protein [Vibrio parahaemolyticus]
MNIEFIDEYKGLYPIYVAYTQRLHLLIEELLNQNEIKYHLVESRAKDVDSFAEKISRPTKNYTDPLNDITDLSGLRVIVYYQDDVERVAKLIEQEFDKVECESRHQAENYDADSFGYLSLHYIVRLNQIRSMLPEWSGFSSIKSEIQIRTVLQHGWATISHAMQYKQERDVPKFLRRKLFRLAGLFELADEEFISLRDEARYQKDHDNEKLTKGSTDIQISPFSLRTFIESWSQLPQLVVIMSENGYEFCPDDIDSEGDSMDYYGAVANQCERIGLTTISQLNEAFNKSFDDFLIKANYWSAGAGSGWRVSNSFVLYLLLIKAFANNFNASDLIEAGWYDKLAVHVVEVAKNT